MSNTTNRKSSIIGYLTDKNGDDTNSLKEFYEAIQKNDKASTLFEETNLKLKLKLTLESSVQRTTTSNSSINKRNDLALKTLELLNTNEHRAFVDAHKIPTLLVSLLDKAFFDKLLNLFQSTHPEVSLKMVKLLIELLGKVLHQNLSIINPLLQIMELAFKHNNRDIKSFSYECWKCLINNFALDRDFFLKPKKFTLLLMPLLNKCKTFKEEEVCKAKLSAWLSLIENINEKMANYMSKVLIPFLNYCFGLTQLNDQLPTDEDDEKKLEKKFEHVMKLDNFKLEHHYDSLNQIGFEVFFSFIFNGQLNWLSEDLKKKFKHVNLNRDYRVNSTMSESICWLFLSKYLYQLFLPKINASFDAVLVYNSWKRIGCLFDLKCKDEMDDSVEMNTDYKEYFHNWPLNLLEKSPEASNINSLLVEKYFRNSVQFVLSTNFTATNKLNNENKFLAQFTKSLITMLKNEYLKNLLNKNDFQSDIIKLIKKSTKILLSSTVSASSSESDQDQNTQLYINNMHRLLSLSEAHESLIDLINWLDISNKFYDYLKSLKTKTNVLSLSQSNYDAINSCIIYPFKYYNNLVMQESDVKLIVNSCTSFAKAFSGLIKQNRIKLESNPETNNVNSWSMYLISNIGLKKTEKNSDHEMMEDSMLLDIHSVSSNVNKNELTFKMLQVQAQFSLYILQNQIEFDLINQLNSNNSSMNNTELAIFMNNYKLNAKYQDSNTNNSDSSFNFFICLVDLLKKQIQIFYDFVKAHYNHNESNAKLNSEEVIEATQTDAQESSENTNNSETPKSASKMHENKQAIQLYCNLIEQMSCLFTRIKSHQLLDKLLIQFASSIELITELNSISKQLQNDQTVSITASPVSSLHKSKPLHHFKSNHASVVHSFQATRRSNDLYDTFSMQIASYIQNNLNKSQPIKQNTFDSILLSKLEPIFYSFLKYTSKLSLKQKTLQAWNGTFGKSTDEKLNYTARLEKLFIELKEEMINKSRTGAGSGGNSSLVALSLPGLKPFDLLHANTNTTTNEPTSDGFITTSNVEFDKENSSLNLNSNHSSSDLPSKNKNMTNSSLKESLLNDSSSSVPMAQLVSQNKQPLKSQNNAADLLGSSQVPKSPITLTTGFVFSPVGRSSATSFLNTIQQQSFSASKINSMKTPDSLLNTRAASPRSLRHNSKRKLDLNGLIDQMPDKDFVEIQHKNTNMPICSLFNDNKKKNELVNNKNDKCNDNKDAVLFKQPLTEHQKEMKRKKSFIPFEMQSVCDNLVDTQTMDSQMSCDDTNSQFTLVPKQQQIIQASSGSNFDDENANDKMDLSMNSVHDEKDGEEKKEVENNNKAQYKCPTTPPSIKFHSKINPKKEIELFEVTTNENRQAVQVIPETVSHLVEDDSSILCSQSQIPSKKPNEADDLVILNESSKDVVKRRSARLKSREDVSSSQPEEKLQSSSQPAKSQTDSKNLTNCLETAGDQMSGSIEKSNDGLSKSNSENKEIKKLPKTVNPKKLEPLSKMERIKIKSKLLKSSSLTTNNALTNKSKKLATSKRDLTKLTNGTTSSTKKFTSMLKKKISNKKLKKYKNLIRNLKSKNNQKKENDNDKLFKHAEELNKIRNSPNKKQSDELPVDNNKKDANEIEIKMNIISKEDDENKKTKVVENEERKEEEEISLSRLANKKKRERQQSVENQQLNEMGITLNILNKSETQTANKELNEVEGQSKSAQSNHVTESLETAGESNQPAPAKTPSEIVNAAIQKLNDTPTSILKKRPVSRLTIHNLPSTKSLDETDDSNTPGKRRVSFCEAVKVEEIEPNNNKSLARLTPRIQNRAKLVLSPYFSTKQQHLSNNSSQPSTTNTSTTISSSLISTTSTTPITSSTNTSISISMTTSTNNNQNSLNNNNSSLNSQSSLLSASPKLNANSQSLTNSQVPTSLNKLTPSSLLSPSLSNQNIMNGNTPGSPGSASLFNFFSNNKQNFLSQRSTIIQQQMLQKSSEGSPLGSSRILPPILSQADNIKSSPKPPMMDIKEIMGKTSVQEENKTKETECVPIYSKLKDSNILIELVFNTNNKNFDWSNYFETTVNDFSKSLKSRNIATLGALCSLNETELNSLPFKAPKVESFLNMIKQYENSNTKTVITNDHNQLNAVLNKLSTCANTQPATYMGSVEEEMAKLEKLESNSCLDTSIECEALTTEINQKQDELAKCQNDPINTSTSSSMDIDINNSDASTTTKKQEEVAAAKPVDSITKFKSFLNEPSNDISKFNLNELDLNEMFKLSEYIEDMEMKFIQFKRKLRLEMMHKHETK